MSKYNIYSVTIAFIMCDVYYGVTMLGRKLVCGVTVLEKLCFWSWDNILQNFHDCVWSYGAFRNLEKKNIEPMISSYTNIDGT